MTTLTDLAAATGVRVHAHLPANLDIPILDGVQAQGDVIVIPAYLLANVYIGISQWEDVPAGGVELLRGVAGGNPHILVADPGTCRYTTNVVDPTGLALVAFETSAPAWLLHPEHGGSGIAPGRYLNRRQREYAEQQRLVSD